MAVRHRSKLDAAHDPRCSLLRRSPSASRTLRKLSEPAMTATCDWFRFTLMAPGGELNPRPGSDHILPPGRFEPSAPASGSSAAPAAPPGPARLKVQLPSAALSTSGEGDVRPPTPGWGSERSGSGEDAFSALSTLAARAWGADCGATEIGFGVVAFGIFGSCRTSKSVPRSPGARF